MWGLSMFFSPHLSFGASGRLRFVVVVFSKYLHLYFCLFADGSKFYGGWCPKGKGHALFPSRDEPQKMTMYFDTRIGKKIGMKPAWVLKTDYVK